MVIAYYLLGYVPPLSILVFTTYKLIKSLKELRDRKKEMTSSSGGKDEVTMSLIMVVIVFTLCQLTNPVSKTGSVIEYFFEEKVLEFSKTIFLPLMAPGTIIEFNSNKAQTMIEILAFCRKHFLTRYEHLKIP